MTALPPVPLCAATVAGMLPRCQAQLAEGSLPEDGVHTYAQTWGSAQRTLLSVSVCLVLRQADQGTVLQQHRRLTPLSQHVNPDLGVPSDSVT